MKDECDPVAWAQHITNYFKQPTLKCERYQHDQPCGTRCDPGPRDDSGKRWHYCYSIKIDSAEVFAGRTAEAMTFLDGMATGLHQIRRETT
jgi:hypothetical protein